MGDTVAEQMQFYLATVTADTEEIELSVRQGGRLPNASDGLADLDAGQHLLGSAKIAVGRNQHASQGVVGAKRCWVSPRSKNLS